MYLFIEVHTYLHINIQESKCLKWFVRTLKAYYVRPLKHHIATLHLQQLITYAAGKWNVVSPEVSGRTP